MDAAAHFSTSAHSSPQCSSDEQLRTVAKTVSRWMYLRIVVNRCEPYRRCANPPRAGEVCALRFPKRLPVTPARIDAAPGERGGKSTEWECNATRRSGVWNADYSSGEFFSVCWLRRASIVRNELHWCFDKFSKNCSLLALLQCIVTHIDVEIYITLIPNSHSDSRLMSFVIFILIYFIYCKWVLIFSTIILNMNNNAEFHHHQFFWVDNTPIHIAIIDQIICFSHSVSLNVQKWYFITEHNIYKRI